MQKLPLANCDQCPYKNQPMVPSELRSNSRYIIIGEGPGKDEVRKGMPFVGASADILWPVLARRGVTRGDCSILNATACLPLDQDEEQSFVGSRGEYDAATKREQDRAARVKADKAAAAHCCYPRLQNELAQAGGDRILLLGRVAQEIVVPQLRGSINTQLNRWIRDRTGHWCLFTWHPAYILRAPTDAMTYMQGLHKFLADPAPGPKLPPPPDYRVIDSPGALDALCEMWETMSDLELCIDTETDQIDWQNDDILCMGIYDGGPLCYVVPKVAFDAVKRWNWKWYKALVRFFNINCQWILQNSKYDQRFLVGQYHLPARCTIDTMLLHGALDERKGTHDLKGLCAQAFDVEDWELEMEQWIGTSKAHNARYSIIPTDNLHQYVRQDVYYTWHLRRHLTRLAQAEGVYEWPFLNLLMPINDLLLEPEITGVQLDVNKLQDMREDYEARLEECEAEIADFTHDAISNPASHVQVAQFLYDELGVKMKKHMNKKPRSTDDEVIAQLLVEQEEAGTTDSDVYKFLLLQRKYRRIAKMLSSYINGLWNCMNSMGEYFNEFQPLGTETGRISSRGITKGKSKGSSLLTFPRPNDRDIGVEGQKIRSVVVPRPGHVLVNCDFSQAELRMAAHVSGDQFLKNAYINKKDLHSEVTKEVFGENFTDEQRQRIKVVNFRWLNGGDVKAQLYARGETISQATANELARRYDTAMATLVAWGKEQERIFHTRHYVQSIFGRKRRAPVINARNAEEIRKAAINFQIQGPSSDVTMLAAVEFVKRRKPEWECILLMTVHDSILVECKEEYKDEVGQVMKQAMLDTAAKYVPTVPYKVDLKTGYAWGDM